MSVSVIVLHYGSRQLTKQCLDSLARFSPDDVHVVLVDNALEWDFDAPRPRRFDYLMPKKNLGFAAGCNYGAGVAHGNTLVFLNNDCRVRADWLEPLLVALTMPNAGAVGPLLVYPDNSVQCSGVAVDFKRPLGGEAWNLNGAIPPSDSPYAVDAVTGACLAIKRDVFERVGGFDTGYWNGYEDVDLCLKLNELGFTNRVTPLSEVVHYESRSDPTERFRCVQENVIRLREKWDPAWPTSSLTT